jgi:hypothetical protein
LIDYLVQIGNDLCQTELEGDNNQLITKENAGQLMYLRVERQTLRRLPVSNTILFTIKTYTTKMEDVCRNDPSTSQRLADAIRNWPPEMIRYKVMILFFPLSKHIFIYLQGADRYKEGLLTYLDMMSSLE